MNRIEKLFKDRVVQRGGINLYSKVDALNFIKECEKDQVYILGVDGFYITEDKTEPSLDNSIDFSLLSVNRDRVFLMLKEFFNNKEESLFFEIIYEEIK
ncbi:hypothetical protein [Algoriphagus antarcticus]|uniref:Uncharacterized protein n=1 Tax=Algoriphagus antarcticus TaxID=238540 RepID=A0A3E0D2F2_9BACT|nr:hypothetical protein [Algoriphagus antarcticus]REG76896.1 hypothetical protein C8N25_1522 [Algoriphagus antarcticus]